MKKLFLNHISHTILFGVFFSFLIIVLPLLLFATQHQQNIAQHAATSNTDITIDFGNRANHSHPIAPQMFGLGYQGFLHVINTVSSYFSPAGIQTLRADADFATIFPTAASVTNPSAQNWQHFDQFVGTTASLGMTPIIIMDYTPSWLQPTPNPCNGVTTNLDHVRPTDVTAWAQLAATVVAHVDQKFPNLNPDYEIWNEPDGTTYICAPNDDQNYKLSAYKAIYAAGGAAIRQQLQKDGKQGRIGGPALAYVKARASLWFPALVSDPTIAPYIDFISYHHYIDGNAGENWTQLLANTRNATTGVAAEYRYISSLVHKGIQPQASTTPIYIDEYNTNVGQADPERNSTTYAPIWNAVYIADLFNTTIDTQSPNAPANTVPTKLVYFTGSLGSTQQFCMFGTINTSMDCTPGNQPYPQYYTYRLLSDPAYLGIRDGGYIANAAYTTTPGLIVSGFYTNTKNDALIINTTGQAYPQLTLSAQNVGGSAQNASVYTIENGQISSQTTPVTLSGNTQITTVHVPAYSVIGVVFTASGGPTTSPTPSVTATPTPSTGSGPSATPTVTPTPTISSNTTSFIVSVCPHGISTCGDNANAQGNGNESPQHTNRHIRISVYTADNQILTSQESDIAFDNASGTYHGNIAMGNISNGSYILRVHMDGYLTKQIPGIIAVTTGEQISLPQVSLITGDIGPIPGTDSFLYGDNQLDIQDYNILLSCFGSKQQTASCLNQPTAQTSGADLDDNGTVDGGDYNLFLRELSVQKGT